MNLPETQPTQAPNGETSVAPAISALSDWDQKQERDRQAKEGTLRSLEKGFAPSRPAKLIRLPAVEDRTGLGKSSIYAAVKAGTMPAPVRLSARAVAWREEEIDQWIAARLTTKGQA